MSTLPSLKNLTKEDLKKLDQPTLLALRREAEFEYARLNNLQAVRKVQLNSCYGALGNRYFRMYDIRLAESVTISGKFVIKWIDQEINKVFNKRFGTQDDYVVFAHTDSMYISLARVVEYLFPREKPEKHVIVAALVDFCQKQITPQINKIFDKLSSYFNAFENKMRMKIEVVADRGIWDGKNRYLLNVYYDEGVVREHPTLKMVGIETVRSSIPAVCRKRLTEAFEIIMRKDVVELREYVWKFKEEFFGLRAEDIAISTSISGIENYTPKGENSGQIYVAKRVVTDAGIARTSGCQRHVKAALIHNHVLRTKGLDKKYPEIKNGDKIKYVSLLPHNPIAEDVVGFKDFLPEEFELTDSVDHDAMFLLTFLRPVEKIASRRGWNLKEESNVLDTLL